jgi:hypothetical protein
MIYDIELTEDAIADIEKFKNQVILIHCVKLINFSMN